MNERRARVGRWVRGAATLLIGLLAGAMAEEYLLLRVVLRELPGDAWVGVHARFADVHPYTVIPTAVLGSAAIIASLVVERDARSRRALATWGAVAVALAVFALTSLVMMPLNDVIQEWTTTGVPEAWRQMRDSWTRLQGLRAALSIAGFAALVAATQLRGAPASSP
jgi:hypothetical protein